MSESAGVRRSTRRREKSSLVFQVGDIVEINRVRGRSKGRLVSRLTDDASSTPRWLVAFDDESWAEEDMYESNFGAILGKADFPKLSDAPALSKDFVPSKKGKKQKKGAAAASKDSPFANGKNLSVSSGSPSPNNVSPTTEVLESNLNKDSSDLVSSPEDMRTSNSMFNSKDNKNKRKAGSNVISSDTNAKEDILKINLEAPSDSSELQKSAAAAARAARSLRRQAKLEEEHTKRQLYEPPAKKPKTKDANVLRIPMLTGTLLLYRGARRRAEFIFKK